MSRFYTHRPPPLPVMGRALREACDEPRRRRPNQRSTVPMRRRGGPRGDRNETGRRVRGYRAWSGRFTLSGREEAPSSLRCVAAPIFSGRSLRSAASAPVLRPRRAPHLDRFTGDTPASARQWQPVLHARSTLLLRPVVASPILANRARANRPSEPRRNEPVEPVGRIVRRAWGSVKRVSRERAPAAA